jgi:RNA polymerase sigma-70 factor (ECF subfamily)
MEPDAWARLVQIFSPIVYRWSRQSGLTDDESADVVQDVFISIAKSISCFERRNEKASFRSWLATITRNRVRDYFRKKDKRTDGVGGTAGLDQLNRLPNQPDDKLEHSISVASLDQRLPIRVLELVKSDCNPKTWQAFWQTTIQGDTAADVADRLEMNISSVYQARSRILRRLRKQFEELP